LSVFIFITNVTMLVGDFVYDMEVVHTEMNCVVAKNLFFNHFIVVALDKFLTRRPVLMCTKAKTEI